MFEIGLGSQTIELSQRAGRPLTASISEKASILFPRRRNCRNVANSGVGPRKRKLYAAPNFNWLTAKRKCTSLSIGQPSISWGNAPTTLKRRTHDDAE